MEEETKEEEEDDFFGTPAAPKQHERRHVDAALDDFDRVSDNATQQKDEGGSFWDEKEDDFWNSSAPTSAKKVDLTVGPNSGRFREPVPDQGVGQRARECEEHGCVCGVRVRGRGQSDEDGFLAVGQLHVATGRGVQAEPDLRVRRQGIPCQGVHMTTQ